MPTLKHWSIEPTADGVTVWIDVVGHAHNIFSGDVLAELATVLDQLEQQPELKFILFRSRKPHSFFAGADIREFVEIRTPQAGQDVSRTGQQLFARIESLTPPTVAIIQGVCLGGGLEMALACDARLVVDDPTTRLGLPETELGILPGWGGTQRLSPLVGCRLAIRMILQGHKLTAAKAKQSGLANRITTADDLEQTLQDIATELVRHGQLPTNPVNRTWSDWLLDRNFLGRGFVFNRTQKLIKRQVNHYPALGQALQAIRIAHDEKIDGYRFEQESIGQLLQSPTCRSLVSLFLNRERARDLSTWNIVADSDQTEVETIAVLGGGTMGVGIAHLAAKSGFQVVVKEVDDDAMHAAQERIEQTYRTLISRGSLTPQQVLEEQAAVEFTTIWPPVSQAQLIIEAVPETLQTKQSVFKTLSEICTPEAILASNTSALPITQISSVVAGPQRVAGLHFFNPVHRMPLVEVVKADDTSEATIGQLLRLCKTFGKTPILVRDSPGFIVNRVLMPYLDEAVKIAIELEASGSQIAEIDREMKFFGMPMGPLELLDQVGLDVAAHVAGSMTVVFGEDSVTETLLKRMIDEGRLGLKTSHGFYNHIDGKRDKPIGIKPLLTELESSPVTAPVTPLARQMSPIQLRLMLAMINEAARCLDENVVSEPWMIDLAMVLGTGFPPFRGGPLQYASQFSNSDLLTTLAQFEDAYGARFAAADWLKQAPMVESKL